MRSLYLLLPTLPTLVAAAGSPCMERDIDYFGNDLAASTRFFVTATAGTKAEVAAMCTSGGGTLASIHSAAENAKARDMCESAAARAIASGALPCEHGCGCYLGLSGDGYGSWMWNDNSPYGADDPTEFTPPWVEWGNTANLETEVIMLAAGLPGDKALDYGMWDDWATGEAVELGLCREDVLPGLFKNIASAEHCKQLCVESTECSHWTWRYHGACWLKNGDEHRHKYEWVSGPARCTEAEGESQCIEADTDYIGHNLGGGTLIDRKHISIQSSTTACRAHCQAEQGTDSATGATTGCTHWTFTRWWTPGVITTSSEATHGACYLKESDEGRSAAFVVSGTKFSVNCVETST